jgi:hypothetical protein
MGLDERIGDLATNDDVMSAEEFLVGILRNQNVTR